MVLDIKIVLALSKERIMKMKIEYDGIILVVFINKKIILKISF
jgi:hypothetical protein